MSTMTDEEIIQDIQEAYLDLIVNPRFKTPRNSVAELLARSLHRIPWLLERAKVRHWEASITVDIPGQKEATEGDDTDADTLPNTPVGVSGDAQEPEVVDTNPGLESDRPDAYAAAQEMAGFTVGDDVVILANGELAKVSYFKRDVGKIVVISEEGIGEAVDVAPEDIELRNFVAAPAPAPEAR